MRHLSLQKKPRGVMRRLRALDEWAAGFDGWFPAELDVSDRYFNIKIPILQGIVEGRHARLQWKVQAAQALINACATIIRSKPSDRSSFRVTCCVNLPWLFASELCIYSCEEYFRCHVQPSECDHGYIHHIKDRSLAKEWGLNLPEGIKELGVVWNFTKSSDPDAHYVCEHWVYGEVSESQPNWP